MTDIAGKHDVVSRDEALEKLCELTTFTPEEAEGALDFIVGQFTEDDHDRGVNWSFALDVVLWVYGSRHRVKPESASYGDLMIYHKGDFYQAVESDTDDS